MTRKWFLGIACCLAMSLASSSVSNADVLANWNFSGLDWRTGQGSGLALNDPAPNPILAAVFGNAGAGLSVSDLIPSTGVLPNGLRVVINATTAAGEADLRDFDFGGDGVNDNFIEFTMTATVAGSLNVDSISISEWRNGTGAPDGMAFDVSVNGGAFSLYDVIKVDSASGSGPSFDLFTFNQVITGANTVAVRFTPRFVNQGSTGNIHVNGLTVNGSISAVPEPGSLVLCGMVGLFGLSRRRK